MAVALAATDYCLLGLNSIAAVCWPSNEWAAWVQAVGSIVAIGATVALANRQHARDVALAKASATAADLQKYRALLQLISGAQQVALKTVTWCIDTPQADWSGDATYLSSALAEMRAFESALERVDPLTFSDHAGAQAVIAGSAAVHAYVGAFRASMQPNRRHIDVNPQLEESAEALSDQLRPLANQVFDVILKISKQQ